MNQIHAPTVLTEKLSLPISINANPRIQSTNLTAPQRLQIPHPVLLHRFFLLLGPLVFYLNSTGFPVTGPSTPGHETFQARLTPESLRKPGILDLEAVIDSQRIAILGREGGGDERERGKELHVIVAEGGREEVPDNDDLALEERLEMEIFRRHQWRQSRPVGESARSRSRGGSPLRAREGLFGGFRRHGTRFSPVSGL